MCDEYLMITIKVITKKNIDFKKCGFFCVFFIFSLHFYFQGKASAYFLLWISCRHSTNTRWIYEYNEYFSAQLLNLGARVCTSLFVFSNQWHACDSYRPKKRTPYEYEDIDAWPCPMVVAYITWINWMFIVRNYLISIRYNKQTVCLCVIHFWLIEKLNRFYLNFFPLDWNQQQQKIVKDRKKSMHMTISY